jgi:hypothetical protein
MFLENVTAFHVITDVIPINHQGSYLDKPITSGCDNSSNELEGITFFHCDKALCDNANCNVPYHFRYNVMLSVGDF